MKTTVCFDWNENTRRAIPLALSFISIFRNLPNGSSYATEASLNLEKFLDNGYTQQFPHSVEYREQSKVISRMIHAMFYGFDHFAPMLVVLVASSKYNPALYWTDVVRGNVIVDYTGNFIPVLALTFNPSIEQKVASGGTV
ncbi:hypothetical protein Fcan01_27765 [Folsomia candida]|uniref:Uncharacterized protein n=1 Tax=Folsomia candida TaxID=158441 RepID=A0A226CYN7_FOLCA|nr:hypothetical protein Fcan01_27765 [Folsomia candida]